MSILVFTVSVYKRCHWIANIHRRISMQISIFTEITSWLCHQVNPHLCWLQ